MFTQYRQRLALGHSESKLSCTWDTVVSGQRIVFAPSRDAQFNRNFYTFASCIFGCFKRSTSHLLFLWGKALSILILLDNVLLIFTYYFHVWQRRIRLWRLCLILCSLSNVPDARLSYFLLITVQGVVLVQISRYLCLKNIRFENPLRDRSFCLLFLVSWRLFMKMLE